MPAPGPEIIGAPFDVTSMSRTVFTLSRPVYNYPYFRDSLFLFSLFISHEKDSKVSLSVWIEAMLFPQSISIDKP